MKKLVLFMIVSICSLTYSQHCPYDGSSIIVVKVHTFKNENTIPNLKVTLVKKKQNKIVKNRVYTLTQTSKFPFLSDEYSIVVGHNFDIENWYLKIESPCEYGTDGWTSYGTTEIRITENDTYNLCGNFDSDEYETSIDQRVYKPIEVILRKRDCETK